MQSQSICSNCMYTDAALHLFCHLQGYKHVLQLITTTRAVMFSSHTVLSRYEDNVETKK